MARAATDGLEGGMAILVSASQISLAAGPLAGGVLVDGVGIGLTFAAATLLILLSAVVPLRGRH
ncbi:hypothetical protein ACFOW4_29615 [Micromonospora sp. GCM10011542]|uniref:hypothetical protein n=1 Tax=Micromonospora sp. GCM10011542 TaxID=3317337 RepID=UPI003620947B